MNDYTAELRDSRGALITQFSISEVHRGRAVHKAQLWYWKKYKGSLGPAHKVLTVSDPAHEVTYDATFNCADKKNKLLPEDVSALVIHKSNGELERETSEGTPHHPPGSVCRVKRRRDFGVFNAPNIRQMKSGTFYYRIILSPQISKGGKIAKKRKYRDVWLAARTLPEAIEEIRSRQLKAMHEKNTRRLVKARSLKLAEYVVGIRELTEDDKKFFAPVLLKYKKLQTQQQTIPAP